jgi:hypothetical protein
MYELTAGHMLNAAYAAQRRAENNAAWNAMMARMYKIHRDFAHTFQEGAKRRPKLPKVHRHIT